MEHRRLHAILAPGAVALALVAGPARAESDPEDVIKYRQSMMKANGAHMAAVASVLQGKTPEYRRHLSDHVRAIERINTDIPALFPKGSDFGETKALAAVWDKRAEFERRAKEAGEKAAAFARTVAAGDAKAQAAGFKALSDACKACHKDFRKEEKQ